jgi:hypothetical protein
LNIPGSISARSKIVSINFGTDVPTQGAALYTTTGATPLIVNGAFRMWGCNFLIGSGAVTAALTLCNTNTSAQLWQSCNLTIVATGGSNIVIGNGSTGGPMICQWNNVTPPLARLAKALTSPTRRRSLGRTTAVLPRSAARRSRPIRIQAA